MPRVESYGQPRVDERPIAGTKITAVPSPDVFGAGLGDVAEQVGTHLYSAVEDRARDHADELALTDFDRQSADWEHQHLDDPQTGVKNTVKGKDALGLTADLTDQYDQFAGGLIAKLNPRQQVAAQRIQAERHAGIAKSLDSYASGQVAEYETGLTNASLANSQNAAVANATDPSRVALELSRQEAIVAGYADHMGMSAAQRDQILGSTRTATHVGVIDQLLATDQDQAAQTYFDAAKDQIDGDKRVGVEKALQEGSLRGQSQRFVDALPPNLSEADALDQVKAITDPKLRDEVQSRIERDYGLKRQAERDDREQSMTAAGNLIDKNPAKGVRAIAPAMWSRFSPAEKDSLERYAKRNLSPDGEGKTDLPTYYGLMTQASTDPEKFAATNLLTYLPKIGKTEFKQLTEIQGSIRKGDREQADKSLSDFRTQNEVVTNQLRLYGVDPEAVKDDAKTQARDTTARVLQMVGERVDALQRNTGKKATNADVQSITDDLLTQQAATPNASAFYRFFGLGSPLSSKRAVDLTIADVPAADRTQIESALRSHGRAVSDEAIIEQYIATAQRLGRGK